MNTVLPSHMHWYGVLMMVVVVGGGGGGGGAVKHIGPKCPISVELKWDLLASKM